MKYKVTLLNLNEINLHISEKYNISIIFKNNGLIKKLLKDGNEKTKKEMEIILKIDAYFEKNNYYDNKFFWCIKSDFENKYINLKKVMDENLIKDLINIIHDDVYLNKYYKDAIIC